MLHFVLVSIAYLTLLGGSIAVCFFGDPDSPGMIGRLTYFFTVWLPVAVERKLNLIPGGASIVKCASGTQNYVCNKPNPILQIVYLALVIGGFLVFNLEAMHLIPNRYMGPQHLFTSHIAVLCTLFVFVRASNSNPGIINKQSFAAYDHWPYDGFIYTKRECPTCNLRKISRSKHCNICGCCVSRFDHHCPWINNCVGEGNYRLFLCFLLSTTGLLMYATWGVLMILTDCVEGKQLWSRKFYNRVTGETFAPSWKIVMTFLLADKSMLMMLLLLTGIMGIMVGCFTVYHFYLISRGTTTNESNKWFSVKNYYQGLAKDKVLETAARTKLIVATKKAKEEGKEVPAVPPEKQPKTAEEEQELFNPETMPALEERLTTQFPTKLPRNIHNKGFIGNFKETFFPPHLKHIPVAPTTREAATKDTKKAKKL